MAGVFPSFDPIFVPRVDNGGTAQLSELNNYGRGEDLGTVVLEEEPSSNVEPPPPKILPSDNTIMMASILNVYKQAAEKLQDGLLNLLEYMEFHDHKTMVQEANLVFDALENLSIVDYRSFKQRVTEFIGCATSLSELDSSFLDSKHSTVGEEKIVDVYNLRHVELRDISSLYSQTSVALMASNDRLKYLIQEESRIKKMLHDIEAEMSCCKAENGEIICQLDQVTQDMQKSELSVQVAKEELEKAQRLKQEQQNVAKASFEKARCKLRESCA